MPHPTKPRQTAASGLQAVIFSSSLLFKVFIFNLAYLIYLVSIDFGTDLFADEVDPRLFAFAVVVVNAMVYLFYRAFTSAVPRLARVSRLPGAVNMLVVGALLMFLLVTYAALEQKTLSLSSSMALVAIAANSRAVALLALAVFAAGVPEALAQDEYIPIVFCALINLYVFVPWLTTRGRHLLYLLGLVTAALLVSLAAYYITVRYSAFKLIERIFEQAAPLSWEGSAWLWFHPRAVIGGMPDERVAMAMDGTWDAQFKVTYLIANAPLTGAIFLLVFAYLLGRFCSSTLDQCRSTGSNVLKNFLKLKLIVILIEVLGEKVFDIEKLTAYGLLILVITAVELAWPRSTVPWRTATWRPT